ncbi:MAG: Gfo/Idh/MocA family oxidoreductase [Kiritimatiellae bacterium]|nr:Gfo/Idh/MocA family oxidoreductase [Kiritimatiellia bacterium]
MNSRRSFLKVIGGAAAFTIIPARILRSETAPSNQLTRALIGFGGIAHSGAHLGLTETRLVAVCDPDRQRMEAGMQAGEKLFGGKVDGYRDFRELLQRKDVDVAHICTPPHWHGPISVYAAQAGKDIWCEKPMTRTIGEGKKVIEAVKANGRIFRINTWFRMYGGFYGFGTEVKPIKKVVQNKLLGTPLRAVVGAGQGFSLKFGWTGLVDAAPQPVPENLDYDLWLGPAPYKPYHPHRVHGNFRGYWDYDGGGLGDMGQHYLDPVQYILDKDNESPVRIDVDAPPQHPEVVGSFRRVTMKYADGTEIILDGDGSLEKEPFISGPNGKLWPGMKSDIPDLDKLLSTLPDPAPQDASFLNALKSRIPFPLNEENAFRSCTLVNLALVAMRAGRGFDLDPITLLSPNDPGVNRFIEQPLRAPWTI